MKDILQEIWSTSKHNKLRTALTGFSVAWGIFMLIFLLGEGNGLINAQLLNSDQFLANSMMVGSGSTSKAYNGLKEGRNIALNQRDIATTAHNFNENIDDVGATVNQSGVTINQGDNYVSTSLEGVYPNKIILDKGKLLYGRYINHIDLVQKRKVLVLDKDQAEQLNRDASTLVGKYVNVGNFAFRVVGILKTDQTGRNSSATTSFTKIGRAHV